MRVTTSQPGPNRFEQSLPLSPSPGSEFWEGSGERRGEGGAGGDKCKGTNIQFEREIIRTNRERKTGKGKGRLFL